MSYLELKISDSKVSFNSKDRIAVTGNFDNWEHKKYMLLYDDFSREFRVNIPYNGEEQLVFKFVLNNSEWITIDCFELVSDEQGNVNNRILCREWLKEKNFEMYVSEEETLDKKSDAKIRGQIGVGQQVSSAVEDQAEKCESVGYKSHVPTDSSSVMVKTEYRYANMVCSFQSFNLGTGLTATTQHNRENQFSQATADNDGNWFVSNHTGDRGENRFSNISCSSNSIIANGFNYSSHSKVCDLSRDTLLVFEPGAEESGIDDSCVSLAADYVDANSEKNCKPTEHAIKLNKSLQELEIYPSKQVEHIPKLFSFYSMIKLLKSYWTS